MQPEIFVRNYLRQHIPDVPTVFKMPASMPPRLLRIDPAPPRQLSLVTASAAVIVQAYGPDDDTAHEVLRTAWRALEDLEMQPEVLGWQVGNLPHFFPDPDRPTIARWQMVGNIIYNCAP
ncbi:hypothetical protein CJBVI_0505 [Corynebacterium jeikeium]|nr:hypothetical protein CJBVI_0505 [Corynebacterium jeikeium]